MACTTSFSFFNCCCLTANAIWGCLAYLHSVSIPIAFGSFHLVQGMPFQSSIQALQQSLLILHLAVLFTLVALHCIVHAYSPAQIFLLRRFFVCVLHILREPLKCLLCSSHQTYFNFALASHSLTLVRFSNRVIHSSYLSPHWYASRIISGLLVQNISSKVAIRKQEHSYYN